MSEPDPHIHVEQKVVRSSATARELMASTFGLVAGSPGVVTAGCGFEVPYAMTSPRPESVTCLACREHARDEHLRFAEQIEHMSGTAGVLITADQAAAVAHRHRDLARRFTT